LPEQLCNKIAAGEVVERPASVVKELVENALDAGARTICLEIESGGKSLIRVTDDGCGMGRDDALLSLERHATSKIRTDEDLFRLSTLGFRGEALPSIASVSRLTMKSCASEASGGVEIYAEGGFVKRVHEIGAARGTTIEVRNLFFNTPARRKFLRKEETEAAHVQDILQKLALASPGVQFRYFHNGRAVLDTPVCLDLRERIASLLGRDLVRQLLELETEDSSLSLKGYAARPECSRSTNQFMFTFINGRFIRDRVVQHALREGYRTLLPKGRYPVAVLFLEIDPAQVDVNVHPTKHEVRFREQGRVHDFIAASIAARLRPSDWLSRLEQKPAAHAGSTQSFAPEQASLPVVRAPASRVAETVEKYAPVQDAVAQDQRDSDRKLQLPANGALPKKQLETGISAAPPKDRESAGFFSSLQVLGQYANSYILCQDGPDLVMIDQHAAHERIRFEQLRRQMAAGGIASQSLLFPQVMEFTPAHAQILLTLSTALARLGFDIEPFGGNSFALKSIPSLLEAGSTQTLVQDLIAESARQGGSYLIQEALDETLMRMACHSVIRAGKPLSVTEISALLGAMDEVDFNTHCPHGRPVQVRLEGREIEKMFKRS